ncbi:MAG TPA: metal ABC transporter permease [Myxococcota bacterium]|jgi:ABC-type Mn2+/Zn2+ transport system permease subunit|nr:metal ABC transporter permease [Myxococcota bacterium]
MSDALPYYLSSEFLFRNALGGGLLVGVVCAVLGVYVVLRRLELLGVALPQASAAGIALSFWASGHSHAVTHEGHGVALLGALGGAFGCLLLLALVRRSPLPPESRVAALYALASAATILFIASNPAGDVELTSLFRGDLLSISDRDLARLVFLATGVGVVFFAFRREILLASVDPEFARTLGKDPARADALLYALLGVAISLGVMCAGPLVVFGFLTLPALAALRVAPTLAIAFAIAAAIAVGASLGGFFLAYRLDLPAGPVEIVASALPWAVIVAASTVRGRRAARLATLAVALAALLGAGPLGCARLLGDGAAAQTPPDPALRGSFPALAPGASVAVLPVRNETGEPLRLAAPNPLADLRRAVGDPFAPPSATVPDALTTITAAELSRRGVPVRAPEDVRRAFPSAPAAAPAAVVTARSAGIAGPLLVSTLRRYRFGESKLLLVHLDLELLDVDEGRLLWSGSARRPIPLQAALTDTEVLIDAAKPLFDEALGTR